MKIEAIKDKKGYYVGIKQGFIFKKVKPLVHYFGISSKPYYSQTRQDAIDSFLMQVKDDFNIYGYFER